MICCCVWPAFLACAMVETHLPNAFLSFAFVPQSSLNAAVPIRVRSALQSWAGLTFPPAGGCPGAMNVSSLIVTVRTRSVCSLSGCDQPPSTTSWIAVIGCAPSAATAAAQVVHWVPGMSCDVSTRHASLVPTRLPVEIHVSVGQVLKLGDGPKETNTFLPPIVIWKRGEPPPQLSSVTLNSALSVVSVASVAPLGTGKLIAPKSFAALVSEKSETSCTLFPCNCAVPDNVKPSAANAGAATAMAMTATTP